MCFVKHYEISLTPLRDTDQNQFKNVYKGCKTFTANIHLVKDYDMNIIKSGSYQPGF